MRKKNPENNELEFHSVMYVENIFGLLLIMLKFCPNFMHLILTTITIR